MFAVINLVALCAIGAGWEGAWPEPRGNPQLTAWQPVPGRMGETPREVARLHLGKSAPTLTRVTLPGERTIGVAVFGGAAYAYTLDGHEAWFSHPAGLNFSALNSAQDFDGDGKPELLLSAGRPAEPFSAAVLLDAETGVIRWRYDVEPMSYWWNMWTGSYLPGVASRQIIVIMHGYPPDPKNGYIAMFEFKAAGGAPEQRWRYDFDKYTCFPSFLQSDLDGDGVKELVVETHSRMWFLDVSNGAPKHFAEWDVSPGNVRSYGIVKFTDLDKDGREDFLCIGNFAQHHEVLLNRDGKMVEAWHHGWPESVTTGKVATKFPPTPDVDVDGDGKPEIVLSMFNAEGEQAWMVRVYDALTGELKYKLPGAIAASTITIDDAPGVELLLNDCDDPTGTVTKGARLVETKDGALVTVWQDADARAAGEGAEVMKNGVRMQLASGFELVPLAPTPPDTSPQFANVPSTVGNTPPKLIAAPLDEAPGSELIAHAGADVSVYRFTGTALEKIANYKSESVPAVADLNGDGKPEIVLTSLDGTTPTIEARTFPADDALLWKTPLPPVDRAGLPQPRKAYVRTIHLTGKPTPDLYVWLGTPVARSLGIDGATGAVLWERGEVPEIQRFWGPSMNDAAAWDYNHDGKEDLVFTNPDYYCIADGASGELLLGPLFPPKIFSQPSQGLYTCPVILPAKEGEPLVCLADGHYFLAAMRIDATPLWYQLPPPGDNRCAAEAFAQDREGNWRIGFGRQDGRFSCLDARDGKTAWDVELAASATDAVAWDADGDGAVDFVFGDSHGAIHRVAIAPAAKPIDVKFAMGRVGVGEVMPTDLDGDGACELVVATLDGDMVVLK